MRRPKTLQRKSKGEITLYIFVSLVFACVAASYIYTFVWAVIAGAKTHTEIVMQPFSLPANWNFRNYIDVFSLLNVNGNTFGDMLFNSIYFSVVTSVLGQFFTMTFAYCCTKYKFPGCELPYTIILIMMTLPLYGNGAASYLLKANLGLIDSYALVILSAAGFTSNFIYYRAYFKTVSWTYAEAAMMDGANHFKIYGKVMIPLAKPIFGALFLTDWLAAWNSYSSELLYHPNLPTLPVGIYQFNTEMIHRARLDILYAACVLVCIPALILFTAFNKVITTNVSVGGIKG